jgi:hypothetical protein
VVHLNRFDTEGDAAMAYNDKARELFGEFALPNFPEESAVGRRKSQWNCIKRGVISRLLLAGKIQWLAKLVSGGYN